MCSVRAASMFHVNVTKFAVKSHLLEFQPKSLGFSVFACSVRLSSTLATSTKPHEI